MQEHSSNPICGPPRRWLVSFVVLTLALAMVPATMAQWVEFVDETDFRLSAPVERGSEDSEEKDYAWADFDKDGDIDLAVARKQGFTTSGKRENVLFMNINGVLTDRTNDFATDSDVPGDEGFNTITNDRDIIAVDVNNDGWLDIITTTAISQGEPKHIGYPRVYMNKCCSVGGCGADSCSTDDWLGFRYEDARIPEMLTDAGQPGFNPCFCAVAAGDVNEDGWQDLYFTDYDTGCGSGDFNDKLLLNQGDANPGFFTDVTEANFVGAADGFPVSAFGASNGIAHFNDDDSLDILKQFAGFVGIAYNDEFDPGVFAIDNSPFGGAAYFVNYGELNNDNKLDLIVSDDGADRYLLNQGTGGDEMADFISFSFSFDHDGVGGNSGDDGFGGNNLVADLNKDGFGDVLITDVDVDVGGCTRRMHIYKNLGGPIGSSVTLQEQTTGTGCETFMGNPASCIVASIPSNMLEGVHDVAVFDINGDNWNDMVVGRCNSTEIYVNVPDIVGAGGVPDGDSVPGSMLTIEKSGSQMTLSWGASCSVEDSDYSIYKGIIGAGFLNHSPVACTTQGATTQTLDIIGSFDEYYLIAPLTDEASGSLGKDSEGQDRHAGINACLPQLTGACD